MPPNLALHQADVRLADGTVHLDATVIARRGEVRVLVAGTVVAEAFVTRVEQLRRHFRWQVSTPEGDWLIERSGGCRSCGNHPTIRPAG